MKSPFYIAALISAFSLAVPITAADALKSGAYTVTQSWSQESDFKRSYLVNVPVSSKPLPLFIYLHGNGGNAERAMHGFLKRNKELSKQHIMVFAQGYLKSWNIVSERSQAPDREFIEAIVTELAEYPNVQVTGAVLMGSSNGAALVNQIAIETDLDYFSHYITVVSQLMSIVLIEVLFIT